MVTESVKDDILSIVKMQEKWRGHETLNLIPSENVVSPAVRNLLCSDFGHRYTSRDKFYMGTRFTDKAELCGEKLAKDLFRSETANLRPLSGHIADFAVLASFTEAGNTIMCVSADDGGYPGIWNQGISKHLRLEVVGLPFLDEKRNIDVEKTEELITEKKPKMVILGASLLLFPYPIKPLMKVTREIGAHIGYDGSHVLGLIAGNQFQDPLREGATVLFGSTHKSFFGPQGGIILADKEQGEAIKGKMFPAFVDNAHWNRIAALALALAEMKEFGREYATQVIKNAQALANALSDYGFPVACSNLGFTKSHQVYLDYGGFGNAGKTARRLEKANIITDCGIRLGTCEITRKGMKQNEMLHIAEFIKRVIKNGEQPSKIKPEVTKLVKEFQEIEYCFK